MGVGYRRQTVDQSELISLCLKPFLTRVPLILSHHPPSTPPLSHQPFHSLTPSSLTFRFPIISLANFLFADSSVSTARCSRGEAVKPSHRLCHRLAHRLAMDACGRCLQDFFLWAIFLAPRTVCQQRPGGELERLLGGGEFLGEPSKAVSLSSLFSSPCSSNRPL